MNGSEQPTSGQSCHDETILLTIIVVTYHSVETCRKELSELARCCSLDSRTRLLVVDNSCDSTEVRELRNVLGPKPDIVVSPSNCGFAAGCNLGVSKARGEWIVLLNPDVLVDGSSFKKLIHEIQNLHDDVFSAAGVLSVDGVNYQGIRMLGGVWFVDRKEGSNARSIGPSGGFAIFRRHQYLWLGGLDERYFAWGEDCEFALRSECQSFRTVAIPVTFTHNGGHSVTSVTIAKRRAYSLALNRVRVARTYYSLQQRITFSAFLLGLLPVRLIRNLMRGTAGADLAGFLDGIFGTAIGDVYRWN